MAPVLKGQDPQVDTMEPQVPESVRQHEDGRLGSEATPEVLRCEHADGEAGFAVGLVQRVEEGHPGELSGGLDDPVGVAVSVFDARVPSVSLVLRHGPGVALVAVVPLDVAMPAQMLPGVDIGRNCGAQPDAWAEEGGGGHVVDGASQGPTGSHLDTSPNRGSSDHGPHSARAQQAIRLRAPRTGNHQPNVSDGGKPVPSSWTSI